MSKKKNTQTQIDFSILPNEELLKIVESLQKEVSYWKKSFSNLYKDYKKLKNNKIMFNT